MYLYFPDRPRIYVYPIVKGQVAGPMKMLPRRYPKKLATNYQPMLHYMPEGRLRKKFVAEYKFQLRKERRLRVFENRVLRRVFGPKRDEVTGEWRKLHNKELSDWYSLPNIVRVVKSRRMRWAGHVARMG